MLIRHRIQILTLWVALLAGLTLVAGCGDDDPTEPVGAVTVDVFFDINVGGQPLILNSLSYANPAGRLFSVKRLKFVLTDVTLHSAQGDHIELADLYFYDLSDASTQTLRFVGGVPHADWNRLTFTYGLDEEKNVRNKYINMTKFQQQMAWPTGLGPQLGYHYMQMEGDYRTSLDPGDPTTAPYATHTGARQLDGSNSDFPGVVDATPYHHFFDVDIPFTATHIHDGGTGEVTIGFDLTGWYVDHTPSDGTDSQYDFPDYPSMIMGNLEVQDKLQTNGPFCFTATMASHGGTHH